ncbi:hypothetical protein M0R04_07105 [Candidatus Dojkabacteria bacterium]|nr:hypothetical protein [Candidatus Dojkabacteria bacterium]
MKLLEIAKPPVDWNTRSEKEQIAMVKRSFNGIRKIDDPSELVQIESILKNISSLEYIKNPTEHVMQKAAARCGYAVLFIKNPSQKVLLIALKEPGFIGMQTRYEIFVKKYFANNTLLMKKWLRYGEAVREQS